MAYMMTCGHNSDDEDGCPFDCPGSKKLYEVEKSKPEYEPGGKPEAFEEEEPEEKPKKKAEEEPKEEW